MANENQMDQGPAVPPQMGQKAERGVTHARKAAEDIRSAVGAMTDEYLGRAEGTWMMRGVVSAVFRTTASNTCARTR